MFFSFFKSFRSSILSEFFLNLFLFSFYNQSEKIATIVKAANLTIESYWFSLFAKLAEKRNINELILNVGAGGGGGAVAVAAPTGGAAGGAAGGSAAPPPEEKKEEPKEESDDDMGFSLFD